jgi:ribosomal protein S18 acetylase RimI-like enzyme
MSYRVRYATLADVSQVGQLFDSYRQFYEQPADLARATNYIRTRLENEESTILVAESDEGQLAGFCQLYATFCSVAVAPILVLYDLFVAPMQRRQGVGRDLMLAAYEHARLAGVVRMELATAVDNQQAQTLYESLGWQRDNDFYHYSLPIS